MIIPPQLFEIPKKILFLQVPFCEANEKRSKNFLNNVEVRYSEHNHPSGKSEPSKHLYQNINHVFTLSVICSAPKIDRTRKNLEAFYIALMRPNLNEQCDSNVLTLFRNGIT